MIQLATLTFVVERFNTGVVSKKGSRQRMEDSYIVQHDIGLDQTLKCSVYTLIDGHGGDWCTKFIQNEMLL